MALDIDAQNDLEQIRQLKARYFRLMDTKQWDKFPDVFTHDIRAVYDGPPRMSRDDDPNQIAIEGREELVEGIKTLLSKANSMHQGFMPEIELTSPTTAKGIWAMFDYVRMPTNDFKGWGHYHEEYVKEDGQWRIKSIHLTRLHVEENWKGL